MLIRANIDSIGMGRAETEANALVASLLGLGTDTLYGRGLRRMLRCARHWCSFRDVDVPTYPHAASALRLLVTSPGVSGLRSELFPCLPTSLRRCHALVWTRLNMDSTCRSTRSRRCSDSTMLRRFRSNIRLDDCDGALIFDHLFFCWGVVLTLEVLLGIPSVSGRVGAHRLRTPGIHRTLGKHRLDDTMPKVVLAKGLELPW